MAWSSSSTSRLGPKYSFASHQGFVKLIRKHFTFTFVGKANLRGLKGSMHGGVHQKVYSAVPRLRRGAFAEGSSTVAQPWGAALPPPLHAPLKPGGACFTGHLDADEAVMWQALSMGA